MRATTLLVSFFVSTVLLAAAQPSAAQCPQNPAGGPTLLLIDAPNDGGGTDLDLGTTGRVHNVELPGLRMGVCLADCDASTDPECTVDGLQPGQPTGPGLSPPMPLQVLNADQCVAFVLPTPAPSTTGTANVQTGAMSIATTFEARLFANPCPTCVGGLCNGGAQNGRACVVERSVTLGPTTYDVSSDCQPGGTPALTAAFPVGLTTELASQATCPGQAGGDACAGAGTCSVTGAGCALPDSGVAQNCCSGDTTRACFPAAGVSRQGAASSPEPQWPSTDYPKITKNVLVSTSCVPATGTAAADEALGLPGPAATEVLSFTDWFGVDTTTTTTSTTIPGGCTTSCEDFNACTTDACVAGACVNTLAPGVPGVRCLIDRMRTTEPCETPLSPKLDRAIDRALARADRVLAKADAATGRKRARLLKKAGRQLGRIFKKVDRAKKKGKVTDPCHVSISSRTGGIKTALDGIQ